MRSDIIVVGGGPAGLATSIFAARAGMQVTLIERGELPRDKPCGEGLMPGGVRLLEEMGVRLRTAHPFEGIRYIDDSEVAEARFATGAGLGIRRTELSRALLEQAQELGVQVRQRTTALGIRDESDGASVETGETTLRAGWVVAADGLHSRARKQAGLAGGEQWWPRPLRYGFRRHFRVRPWSRFVEVYWARGGEAYVTPVSETELGVALLWHESAGSYEAMLSRFPTLEARLRGAPATSVLKGAGPFHQKTRRVHKGRVALVGDAAGYLDALTGEGVALAFRCSRALVATLISEGGFGSYEALHRRLSRRYIVMTELVLMLSWYPSLRRHVIRSLSRHPDVFRRLLAVLSDESRQMFRGRA